MAGLRPGESFLSAATRDRKIADRKAAERKKNEPSAEAKAWAAQRSIFVPAAFTENPKPPKKNIMPGTEYKPESKRTPSQKASDKRRSEVRALTRQAEARREFSLGLSKQKQLPTIFDAVPVGRTKQDQSIANALAHPPKTLSPRELHDWKTRMIGLSGFTPGEKRDFQAQADAEYVPARTHSIVGRLRSLGGAVAEGLDPLTSLIVPNAGGLDPRRAPEEMTPEDLKKKYERATQTLAGRSVSNLLFNADVPNTWGQAGGLAAGVLTLGPAGKVGRALGVGGKLAYDAIKAEEGIRAAMAAAKVGAGEAYRGPSVTEQVIKWGRAARANRVGTRQVENIRANAGMLVKTREALLAKGEIDGANQIEEILASADIGPNGEFHGWDEAATGKRAVSKTAPANVEKGIVRGNTKTVLNDQGIHVAGPFTDEQWVEKVLSAFPTQAEREQWSQWYEEFAPAFREAFGEHAEAMMRGFAVSQANNSPTGGLLAALRVLDRLTAGDSARTISNKGIGTKSLVKTIAKAVEGQDGKVDQGVAAKLSDFIDSFLNKDTRTWMGDRPEGGMPSAIDVHAMRDQGLIDKKLAAKLEAVHGLKGYTQQEAAKLGRELGPKEFVIDSSGSASGPLYERLSERYEQIARYLNERVDPETGVKGFDGRTDWKPKEVQALGWGATQKTHGVDPENLGSAFAGNTRRFNLTVGNDLTAEEAQRVSDALVPHIEKIISQAGKGSFPVRAVEVGVHGDKASLHFQVMSSPEEAQKLSNRLARIFKQYNVTAYKEGGQKAKPHLRFRNIPDEETARRIWSSLRRQDPKKFKGQPTFLNGELLVELGGKTITAEQKKTFAQDVAGFVDTAIEDAGIPPERPVHYDGVNLQILKGKDDASDLRRVDGGGRGQSLERRTDAQASRALDRAVRGITESRARAAARALVSPQMGIVPPGTVGPGFARQIEQATARASRVPRFASEAVPRTADDIEQRITELGSKLDPIVADIAAGLRKQGIGKGTRASLARTDKPDYFNTFGDYEAAKQEAYRKRAQKWKKQHPGGGMYQGSHYTNAWPEWGEDPNTFVWGNPDTYALESGAEVATDQSTQWYRDLAERQLTDQLARLAAEGGEDGLKARRMLIMFQERDSLRELLRKNQTDVFFGADEVPGTGYGSDLRARRLTPQPTETPRPAAAGAGAPPPRVPPVARQLPDPSFDADYVKKLSALVMKALPENKKLYAEQAGLRSEEKAKRLKEALHQLEMGEGTGPGGMIKARIEARKALKGALPKLEWEGFDFLDQDAYEALMVHALHHPDLKEWERIRVIWALDRAMKKGVVTPSEEKLLRIAFGPRVAENLANRENMTVMRWLYQMGLELWNTPRALMASFDLSAPFRQGLVAGARHPILFGKNMAPMVRSFGRENSYTAIMSEIAGRENFHLYEKAKLAIQDAHGASNLAREEAFPGSLAERIPGTKQIVGSSSRAYSAFLNKMRADIFDSMIEVAKRNGKDVEDPKFLDALGEFINTSTGRGRIPTKHGEDAAQFLSYFLFSPRLLMSRFQILNPVYYISLYRRDPFVAMRAAQSAVATLGGIMATLTLASRIPGVEVGLNPTSSDFGKIRIGDTRIDLAGGFQPLLVMYMRIIKRRTTTASTGVNRPLGGYGGATQWALLQRFLEGKMAPTPGLIRDLMSDRKTYIGDPLTAKGAAWNMLVPLNIQGGYEAGRNDGLPMGIGAGLLGSVGFGTNSFPDTVPERGGSGGNPRPGSRSGGNPRPGSRSGGNPRPGSGGGGNPRP